MVWPMLAGRLPASSDTEVPAITSDDCSLSAADVVSHAYRLQQAGLDAKLAV